jgi:hypothetical protein
MVLGLNLKILLNQDLIFFKKEIRSGTVTQYYENCIEYLKKRPLIGGLSIFQIFFIDIIIFQIENELNCNRFTYAKFSKT